MARNYCGTSFDLEAPVKGEFVKYLIYQKEKCPESGKEHWQFYAEFSKMFRMKAAMVELGVVKGHLEKRRGTQEQARDYCKKLESAVGECVELGELAKQGKRNDLDEIFEDMKLGKKADEVMMDNTSTWARNYRAIEIFEKKIQKNRNWPMEVHIIWGDSGAGKSHSVVEKEGENLFIKNDGIWWDGYEGQEAVLFDDMFWDRYWEEMSHKMWLKLFDKYALSVPVKGGMKKFVSKRIYLTSMFDPEPFLKLSGIKRRITSVSKMSVAMLGMGNTGHAKELESVGGNSEQGQG